jgi:protein-disulfide isomerase
MTTQGHPEQEVLMAWRDGELAGAEETQVRAHVGECADCQRAVQAMGAVGEQLAGWKVEPTALKPPAAKPVMRRPIVWIAAAAAAVLVAAAVVLPRVMGSDEREGASARPFGRSSSGPVRVEIFGDWLCSPCVQPLPEYVKMATELNEAAERSVVIVWRDFPLDSTCNPHVSRTTHTGACDAALAVRLAREQGNAEELIARFAAGAVGSAEQELKSRLAQREANPALVMAYEQSRKALSRDIAEAHERKVTATPFVFVNGELINGADGVTVDAVRAAVTTALANRPPPSERPQGRKGGYR